MINRIFGIAGDGQDRNKTPDTGLQIITPEKTPSKGGWKPEMGNPNHIIEHNHIDDGRKPTLPFDENGPRVYH